MNRELSREEEDEIGKPAEAGWYATYKSCIQEGNCLDVDVGPSNLYRQNSQYSGIPTSQILA